MAPDNARQHERRQQRPTGKTHAPPKGRDPSRMTRSQSGTGVSPVAAARLPIIVKEARRVASLVAFAWRLRPPSLVFALIASIALHVGALYTLGRVARGQAPSTRASVKFRRGDHAIQLSLTQVSSAPNERPGFSEPERPVDVVLSESVSEAERIVPQPSPLVKAGAPPVPEVVSVDDADGRRLVDSVVARAHNLVERLERSLEAIGPPHALAPADRPDSKEPPRKAPISPTATIAPVVLAEAPLREPATPLGKTQSAQMRRTAQRDHNAHEPAQRAQAPRDPAGVAKGASAIDLPAPRYPLMSRRLGEEGLVTLEVEVLADGRVGKVRVMRDPGFARLRDAAVDAVRRARFEPARRDGRPVASRIIVPVRFRLR